MFLAIDRVCKFTHITFVLRNEASEPLRFPSAAVDIRGRKLAEERHEHVS
jgi:hypothetical protein